MKRILILLALLLLANSLVAAPTVIVKKGRSQIQIVTPDHPSPAVTYAAGELQKFIEEISGAKLPIVSETKARRGAKFLLGPCRNTIKAGLVERASKLGEDGVLIKTIGKDIALLGQNERGNLYSVYVLLEKYWGVRFLAWDCTVVPKRTELSLPEVDYSYASPFMYRETLTYESLAKEIAARQRLNGPMTKCDASVGGKIDFFPYVHSFDDMFPESEYFKEHPEYFGLNGGKRVGKAIHGQLCLSNPDVLRIAKEKVLKWAAEKPDVPILDVSQNDGNGACECDNCMAIVKEEKSQHGPILRFVNAIAEEVAKKYPDRWVETLAYAYSVTPPAITKPRTNVIIRLCHVGCYFHGFEQCNLGSDLAGWLDQWRKLTRRIFVWHYATAFNHYLAPNPNLNGLAKDLQFYGSHGVNGVMVQSDYSGPGGELAELREYLSAQLMWDPTQDPMRIREEFCRGYYGPAAPAVLEFLATMDKLAKRPVHAFATWDPQTVSPPEFVDGGLKILQRALALADDPVVSNRIEKLMLPLWYVQLLYPDKYGLAQTNGVPLVARVRRVIEANKITHVSEAATGNAQDWLLLMEARHPAAPPKDMVFDFLRHQPVKTEYCLDWRLQSIERDGRRLPAIFHHPDNDHNGDANFEIALPADTKTKLTFATVITGPTANGVRFSILVNGKEIWYETKTVFLKEKSAEGKPAQDNVLPSANPFSDHTLDLSAYAGQKINLTLRVNALSDSAHDWANWIEPRIAVK